MMIVWRIRQKIMRIVLYVFFWFYLDCFVLVLFAFVVLALVLLVVRQEIGWEERLRNDLFFVEWDVKRWLDQSIISGQME